MGNSRVDGDVSDSAVAVMGNVTVNGTVGSGGAVAVLGNVYVNGKVNGDVVAVLGNVKLGPQAVINGEVTEILGTVERSPTAVISGRHCRRPLRHFRRCRRGCTAGSSDCLFFGRPLAPNLEVSWAWWVALATPRPLRPDRGRVPGRGAALPADARDASRCVHSRHDHRRVAHADRARWRSS